MPVPPDRLWERFRAVDEYSRWWPWLRSFEATALVEGEAWRCTVQPPLPYRVRFTIRLDAVRPCEHVEATIAGDIRGAASLIVSPHPSGSMLRLRSDLTPDSRHLRLAARILPPVVRAGHRWVVDTGARQFTQHAL